MGTGADFSGCYTRLKWIDHALNALDEEFRVWMLEHDVHKTTVEYQPEANVHLFRLTPDLPPQRFGVVAGNIVHQLRATLDNLVWQLVIANGAKPRGGMGGNQFPIIKSLDPNVTFAQHAAKPLRGVDPRHVALIEGLQPCTHKDWPTPDDHPLGYLANLSNTDKHQVLQPVFVEEPNPPVGVGFVDPNGQGIVESGCFPPGDKRYPGAIVGWAELLPSGFHPDVRMDYGGVGRLAFTDGVPLLPRLREIFAVAEICVRMFEPLTLGNPPLPITLNTQTVAMLYEVKRLAAPGSGRFPPFLPS